MAEKHPAEEPAQDPALAVAARHALHDEELVAAFAAADTDEDESARARSLIERCTTCAALADDIAAITGAVRSFGDAASAAGSIRAPRDFRLTPEDVGLARPAGLPGRIGALLGGIAAFGRPVGATLATFGLVGLLVGTMSLAPLGASPASAPGSDFGTVAPGSVPVLNGGAAGPGESPGTRSEIQVLPEESGDGRDLGLTLDSGRPEPSVTALVFAGSVSLLVLGAALLWAGSRNRRSGVSDGRS